MLRHHRWNHGKYFRSVSRLRLRHRLHRAIRSAGRSAGHHHLRRRRSGRPCWASGRRQSAGHQEGSRPRRRSGRSDRHHSDRRHSGRRSDRPRRHRTGRRPARRHHPGHHLASHRLASHRLASHRLASHHPVSRRSFRPRHSAYSNRSGRLANRCYPTTKRKTASRPGSASKHRHRRCCCRPKACSASCAHHLSSPRKSHCFPKSHRSTARTAWMKRTIAAAGSRPSGIRRLLR
jgi:hypothetical protein